MLCGTERWHRWRLSSAGLLRGSGAACRPSPHPHPGPPAARGPHPPSPPPTTYDSDGAITGAQIALVRPDSRLGSVVNPIVGAVTTRAYEYVALAAMVALYIITF